MRNHLWSEEFLIWEPIPVLRLPTLLPPKGTPVPAQAANKICELKKIVNLWWNVDEKGFKL